MKNKRIKVKVSSNLLIAILFFCVFHVDLLFFKLAIFSTNLKLLTFSFTIKKLNSQIPRSFEKYITERRFFLEGEEDLLKSNNILLQLAWLKNHCYCFWVADEEHLNMLSITKSELVLVKSYFMNRIIGSSRAPLTCICVIV